MSAVTRWVCGMGVLLMAVQATAGGDTKAPKELPLPVAPVVLTSNGMEILWQTEAVLDPGTRLKAVWLVGPFLVGLSSDQRIHAIDAATGVRLWSEQVAGPQETVWPPAIYKTDLWVATTTKLIGFDGFSGKRIPIGLRETDGIRLKPLQVQSTVRADNIELDFGPAGRPVTDGVHCFIPDAKGWLQAVSITPRVVPWGRWTDDTVTAGPVVDGALVYFGGHDGKVYASTRHVRRIVWQYKTEGAIVADLKRTKTGLVLAASLDYSLYAFQGTSGRVAWRYNAGERIRRAPYTLNGQVFVFTKEAGLAALDESNGKALWRLEEGDDIAAGDAGTVYVLSRGNDLLAVSRDAGQIRFGVPLRAGTLIATNETDSAVLYLASPEGQIVAAARKREAEEAAPKEAVAAQAPALLE